MAVIIEINDGSVLIGTDDGGLREVMRSDLNFSPEVGDEVTLYENEDRVRVVKARQAEPQNDEKDVNISVSMFKSQIAPVIYDDGLVAVNKVLYCVLCICLGGLGVHKFYAGRIGTGLLYLIFSWTFIPLILAVLEFCNTLSKPSDADGMIFV